MVKQTIGLQESSYGRRGFSALFDYVISLLKEKIPTIGIKYGGSAGLSTVTPFYSASFPSDYHKLPAVIVSTQGTVQKELGIGQVALGPSWGDYLGVTNITSLQIDIWGRNRVEQEEITTKVLRTIQRYKRDLYAKGIRDIMVFDITDRVFDPNSQRAWWGASQITGEIWMKIVRYTVVWDEIWSPNIEDGVTEIEKVDITMDMDGSTITTTVGLMTLGLLDSMYLTRQLGRGIKIIRTGGRH
ncbi:MAG: hypothetical protein DRP09_12190 [Candidatus Thorarchaeota archaeon]|nr:MAG: hypothetical protein DRP09_12190 [Candidatus Thorarchaeota archaeon]